jgi:hypothetical protein
LFRSSSSILIRWWKVRIKVFSAHGMGRAKEANHSGTFTFPWVLSCFRISYNVGAMVISGGELPSASA